MSATSPPPLPTDTAEPEADSEAASSRAWRRWWQRPLGWRIGGFSASCLFHAALIVALALVIENRSRQATPGLVALYRPAAEPPPWRQAVETATDIQTALVVGSGEEMPRPRPKLDLPDTAARADRPERRAGLEPERSKRHADEPLAQGGGLEGRASDRARLAESGGGSRASEAAVEKGLQWLAAHQLEGDNWSFDHSQGPCRGLCRNPGTASSTTAATAMAMASFLGAGYTHKQGEYKDLVRRGLYYLLNRARVGAEGASFLEGGVNEGMYAQGLAGIALAEGYAMTGDLALADVAQKSLDFIVYAQDKRGGGWRYTPGEPGDTTVTGWQLMALKSGRLARLDVSREPFYLAAHFLDGVSSDGGAQYGYLDRQPRPSTTAIGLLMRMYLDWPLTHPALVKGVALLDRWGPSKTDMYYNYYATQVLRHWGGAEWQKWNYRLRDYLVATQAVAGHEAGSWYFEDEKTAPGGRLYNTAMAIMMLEVYYRYMPLYQKQAAR